MVPLSRCWEPGRADGPHPTLRGAPAGVNPRYLGSPGSDAAHTCRVWLDRASAARRDIAAMAATGLGVGDLHAAALQVVGRYVGTELTCWATIDPETLGITAMRSGEARIAPEYEPRLAEAEYAPGEPHTFAALVTRGQPVGRLSDLPDRERARSARVANVWRPLGLDRELRVPFVVDGRCWGAAGMVRSGCDFSDREIEFLLAVAPVVASATRLAVRTETLRRPSGGRPAIVVVGPRGEARAVTAAALEWRERLEELVPGWFDLMVRTMSLEARTAAAPCRRLGTAGGRWAVLEASPLIGGDDVAVTIDAATGDRLTGLLMLAYGLTARERDVCREVMAGYPTADIAAHLVISAHTVQDHLKAVFAKLAIHSRGELVAALRPELPA